VAVQDVHHVGDDGVIVPTEDEVRDRLALPLGRHRGNGRGLSGELRGTVTFLNDVGGRATEDSNL
jgi:hypothetical protein